MSKSGSEHTSAITEWPTFALRYTFNPSGVGIDFGFAPDEVVVFDATRGRPEDRWIAAERGSYVSVEETR